MPRKEQQPSNSLEIFISILKLYFFRYVYLELLNARDTIQYTFQVTKVEHTSAIEKLSVVASEFFSYLNATNFATELKALRLSKKQVATLICLALRLE